MDYFTYRDGEYYAEGVPLRRIAAEVGTPFYCYSTATLLRHYNAICRGAGGLQAAHLLCGEVQQ